MTLSQNGRDKICLKTLYRILCYIFIDSGKTLGICKYGAYCPEKFTRYPQKEEDLYTLSKKNGYIHSKKDTSKAHKAFIGRCMYGESVVTFLGLPINRIFRFLFMCD